MEIIEKPAGPLKLINVHFLVRMKIKIKKKLSEISQIDLLK